MEIILYILMIGSGVWFFKREYVNNVTLQLWQEFSGDCLAAMHALYDADDTLTDWRRTNPGVYIGISDEGCKLVVECIEAYEWFLRTHPFIDDTAHLEDLKSLFNDLPPRIPQKACGLKLHEVS